MSPLTPAQRALVQSWIDDYSRVIAPDAYQHPDDVEVATDARDILVALLAATEPPWQDIATHHGEQYEAVLIVAGGVVGEASLKDNSGRVGWWWANTDPGDQWADEISEPPTHWMPLPEGPKALPAPPETGE